MLLKGQSGCIRAKMVVFWKSGCIGAKWCIRENIVVFEKKKVVIAQICCIGAKMDFLGQSGSIRAKVFI